SFAHSHRTNAATIRVSLRIVKEKIYFYNYLKRLNKMFFSAASCELLGKRSFVFLGSGQAEQFDPT
ncbi:MAG: hypothetical protein K9K39_07750, partial [Desulfohalobiaceae bacterium]|nr:hypothetical protein [Desulfohalobiaceae bacterium]